MLGGVTAVRQAPGRDVTLEFRVLDPKTGRPVTHYEVIHEKLFHLFLVSQDLTYFSHEHPVLGADGWFRLKTRLPRPGTYRLLADFDPTGGTPQLAARTFSTAGWIAPLAPWMIRARISIHSWTAQAARTVPTRNTASEISSSRLRQNW